MLEILFFIVTGGHTTDMSWQSPSELIHQVFVLTGIATWILSGDCKYGYYQYPTWAQKEDQDAEGLSFSRNI